MPSRTTVTEASSRDSGTHAAIHKISFNGMAGTLFWCNILALILYTLGFATVGWQVRTLPGGSTVWVGLWHTCTCSDDLYGDFGLSQCFMYEYRPKSLSYHELIHKDVRG